jgi:glycosyltransferase involved in cell wall biosynthesis
MRDLLVTSHTPVLGSGRALRTYGVACALAAHRGVDLLYVRFGADMPDAAFRAIPGIEFHDVTPSRGARRLVGYAAARMRRVPQGFARGISPELSARAAELARVQERGRVIADGPTAAAALSALARARPVVYNAHNIESHFRVELEAVGRRRAMSLRAFERGVLERACESWMVSHADVAAAQELCPSARLRYVPNVVDVSAIEPVPQLSAQPRAIFVGSFSYEPNRNALRFLLDDVMPRVWSELPDARLALVGSDLTGSASADPRVETVGFVEDLAGAYAGARCALAPLLQGGGTPLKLLEALAYGVPVVATTLAVAGLEVRDGEQCLVADGPEPFARAMVSLLRAPAPELGQRGRQLVAERYSIEALSKLLDD